MPRLDAIYLAAWGEQASAAGGSPPPSGAASSERIVERLVEIDAAARREWPGVDLPAEVFARKLGEHARGFDDPLAALARLRTSAIFLTCACARGDDRALAAFDRAVVPGVRAALARSFDAHVVDDAVQRMLERLFVGTEQAAPSIGSYAGRGDLVRWAQVGAEREALRLLHGTRLERPSDDDTVFDALLEGIDEERSRLKEAYRAAFREALEGAFLRLTPRERAVLRYHYVDGLNIDEIGKLYDVHRATVARWREQARVTLFDATRAALAGVSDGSGDLRSILGLIQSQLDASVRRLLESRGDDAG